nr:hypothetical protein [Tanacetum cinerariifolium]
MLLAMKDEAGSNLNDEENDFMLENAYRDETLEELATEDRIVYKIGQSIQTIHMLGKTPYKVYNPFLKAGLGYQNLERLKKNITAQQKMYDGEELHNTKLIIDSPDSEETLEEAEEKQKNEMLMLEIKKISNYSKDIQATMKQRIKILENDFKRAEAQYIKLDLQMQNKRKRASISWESRLSKFNDENVLLNTQVDSVVQERENIKLEYQKLFNLIKEIRVQHQHEVNELIENINKNTYAYGDLRSKNQDLLMIIFELKDKLKTIENEKNVNTEFDKSKTTGKLVCVTSLNINTAVKAKKVSNT